MSDQARGVRRFVERTAPPRSSADGFVVAAGKGGVGTSTTALLLAFAARPYGPVALVDAQGGFGGPDRLLGIPDVGGPGVSETPLGSELVLIHGGAESAPGDASHRAALRRVVRGHGDATVIVDAGARPATVLAALADYGTRLITVMTADGISSAAGYGLAKLAWGTRPETTVSAVGNRVGEAEAGLLQDGIRSAARRFTDRSIAWLGHLPDGPTLQELDASPWATLDQTEPALMDAAAAIATRLFGQTTTHTNSTLHLLK